MNKKELEEALIFPQGEKNPYGAYFTGQSYLEGMIADKDLPFGVGNVTFEPGCRNHWHIHKDGYQVLLVTAGEGWYQEEGKAAQLLHAGDTIVTHAGVKHWHGATKDSWFSHVAITAGEAVWLEEFLMDNMKISVNKKLFPNIQQNRTIKRKSSSFIR